MDSVRVRQYVGQDGILHLDVPIGLTNREIEVMVVYQAAQKPVLSSLEHLYGICADDPIRLDDEGIAVTLDDEQFFIDSTFAFG
jgi:hypothetical protein